MSEILQWDRELFLYLNKLGSEPYDAFWLWVSETGSWIPFYVLLAIFLPRMARGKQLLFAFLVLFLNVFFTDSGSVWLFKEQFQRLRPCHVESLLEQMRLVKEGCGGQYGFVSSHAANTFGLATLYGLISHWRHKWVLWFLMLWAILVSFSRIYLGVHYPLDIICGGIYGAFCGWGSYHIFKALTRKFTST